MVLRSDDNLLNSVGGNNSWDMEHLGSTDTSLWTHYNSGDRVYCGIIFQDGMRKNDKLPENVITPTSKSDMHDELTSPQQILEDGIMTEEDWNDASSAALDLFKYGQEEALKRGLILVDTKYEFGKNSMGKLMLVDEVRKSSSCIKILTWTSICGTSLLID